MDAIAELERQLQAAASTPDPSDRAVKIRALRERLSMLHASADRLLSNAQESREAEAAGAAVRRMEVREDADLREALEGDLDAAELGALPTHGQLDELAEEGLLEEAILGRGGKALRSVFDPLKHPRGRSGQWRETPDAPGPRRQGRATPEPDRPGKAKARKPEKPERKKGRATPEAVEKLAQHEEGERQARSHEKPVVTSDVDEAIELLGQGHRVELTQPRQLTLLVDKLAAMVKEAEAAGEDAGNYDLCRVTIKGTNVFCLENKGVPRVKMPQLKGDPAKGSKADAMERDKRGDVDLQPLFREHLRSLGVAVTRDRELADRLRASQRELIGVKVAGIASYLRDGGPGGTPGKIEGEPLLVARNNYIVDGHHRWAAEVARDYEDGVPDTVMAIERIDMDILEILVEAVEFAKEWGMQAEAGFVEEALRQALEEGIREPWRERALRRLDGE